MTSTGYVRALRARWFTVVAITLVVTCLAVLAPPAPRSFSKPSTDLSDVVSASHTRYRTTTVLGIPPSGNVETQFRTIQFYLRSSEIQAAFAERIGYTGTNRGVLSRVVTVDIVPAQGSMNVSGYGGTPEQASTLTNAFVATLEAYLAGLKADAAAKSLASAQQTVDDLAAQIETLGTEIQTLRDAAIAAQAADPEADPDAGVPSDSQILLLQARRDSLSSAYAAALQTLTRLSNAADDPPTAQLTTLTAASPQSAVKIDPSLIYRLPIRIIIGLLLGLLLGATAALILEYLSRKVSSRDAAERAFRSRVLVEIPRRKITGSLKDVAIVSVPTSSVAVAYRMLRAVLVADRAPTSFISGGSRATDALVARALGPAPTTARDGSATPTHGNGRELTAESSRRSLAVDERSGDAFAADDDFDRAFSGTAGSSVAPATWSNAVSGGQVGAVFVLVAPTDEPVLPVVVANLAASFAEAGSDVIVLRLGGTDPGFGPDEPGQHDVWARESAVAGVQTVDWRPGPDTAPVAAVVEALRAEGSVVLVDAGRAATAEFAEVAPLANGVVAVCEYGVTRLDDADRAADIIAWSHGDFRGVVLAQVPSSRRLFRSGPRNGGSPLGRFN